MNSIAIWYEKTVEGDLTPEIDLHLNHWKLKYKQNWKDTICNKFKRNKKQNSDYFLDMGLMIRNGGSIGQVCIYLPGDYNDKNTLIEDLGTRLTNKKVITAVFNSDYNICTTNSKIFPVNDTKGSHIFNVYKLDIQNDITLTNSFSGTIIKFPFTFTDKPTYYRIRIKSQFLKSLSYIYTPKNSFLESASSSVEIIDFRINDTRNLDLSLVEHIQMHNKFEIKKVHFFVMRRAEDEYILSNDELHSIRQLEENTWENYIDHGHYKMEKVIAYHLKKDDNKIDEFSGMLKFRFEDIKITRHLIVALGLALLFELLGHGFFEILKRKYFNEERKIENNYYIQSTDENSNHSQIRNSYFQFGTDSTNQHKP